MPHYKYLIIGGGMTAAAAVAGIREVDAAGAIGIVSAEPDKPYDRPPLSKGLWKDKTVDSLWRLTGKEDVAFHLERTIAKLDLKNKTASDSQKTGYTYEKLLLATGGRPRLLPFPGDEIIYYRTLEDYRRLRALTDKQKRFVVIGGGFIGSEIAAALAMNGKQVTMIYPGKNLGEKVYPAELSQFVTELYRQKGVELLPGESAVGLEARNGQWALKLASGREIVADGVVAGIGIQPNVELAQSAGLKVDNGIVVNESLQTTDASVYAAGDVASFYNPTLAKQMRVEHEDGANTMGKLAGRNMAGKAEPYRHLPFFYSDLFELGYEAVGELDARLETFADWKTENREGVIYYLRGGRVRGVLLWNTWGQVDAARALIAESGPFTAAQLKGRLPKG